MNILVMDMKHLLGMQKIMAEKLKQELKVHVPFTYYIII